ncbi:MAG: MoxR family ATPase [Spirochaetales bacterium]|nr:MoxR family ATPase [Spirochaetales bacterium]
MAEEHHGKILTDKLNLEISKAFAGKTESIRLLLLALFGELHVLIEDIPGVGKTTLAKCLAACCGMEFGRIQFTPDLLPGDITGMNIWDPVKREFIFKEGGIMHQVILADEINRATARTQAALLEAMEEEGVTIDGRTIPLPPNFMVIATQNPTEFTGTFTLPEAQLDRFGISFSLGYPEREVEKRILDLSRKTNPASEIEAVTTPGEIKAIQEEIRKIHAEPSIKDYIINIAEATRNDENLRLGLSPRGAQHLFRAAGASAFLEGRDYLIPEDVMNTVYPVCRHRLLLSPGAAYRNMTTLKVIEEILSRLHLPSGIN